MLDQGIDPAFQKKTDRLALSTAETVRHLADEFSTRFIAVHRRRPQGVAQILNADVLPKLGGFKVKDVTRRHVVKMLDGIVDRGARVQANRTASLVKQMFQYAVERGIIDANPCSDIRRQTVGGTEQPRDRTLDHGEIKALWSGLDLAATVKTDKKKDIYPIGKAMAAALKLLLVTAQRRGELTNAKWADIDFQQNIWHIPAERSKNGKAHRVPLSTLAHELLDEVKQYAGKSAYVLPTPHTKRRGDAPITERSLTNAAERAQKIINIDKWIPHD